MGNMAYRKSAVLSVGGFNEKLQREEDEELVWRLRQAGYKTVSKATNMGLTHLEGKERFTFSGYLKRRWFWDGYWQHQLFYLHPKIVKHRGLPTKLAILIVILIIAFKYPVLFLLPFLWLSYSLYKNTNLIGFCLSKSRSPLDKILTLLIIPSLLILSAIMGDIGKIYAMFDKARGKVSKIG